MILKGFILAIYVSGCQAQEVVQVRNASVSGLFLVQLASSWCQAPLLALKKGLKTGDKHSLELLHGYF